MADTGKVNWLNQGNLFWDQTLLKDLLKDYSGERTVFVVPGSINDVDDVSMEMHDYSRVTVIITSDEQGLFPVSDLYHPDMRIIVTYPQEKHRSADGYLPIGYTPQTRELVKKNSMSAKSLDWFFAGQDTHKDRHEVIAALTDHPNGKLVATEGFAQGLPYEEYMQYMCQAKVVPCPGGPFSQDSFRLYEALEAGCIPIVKHDPFWAQLFGEVPFPMVYEWDMLLGLIDHYKDRPDINNKCQVWWALKKKELKCKIRT